MFPGAFDPPTVAHLAMASRAAEHADEVILLVAESMPHKAFEGVGFESRIGMLSDAASHPRLSVASSPQGLYLDIAESCRAVHAEAEIALVCGTDAAQRILSWPYENAGTLDRLFGLAELWVFSRLGEFRAPDVWRNRVRAMSLDDRLQVLSSSEVRRRIAAGDAWRHLVPEEIHDAVERWYGRSRTASGSA